MTRLKSGKKVPLRRCIGCMQYKEKAELIRIFKNDEARIVIDDTFKAGGRGAYICKDTECLEKAFKHKALEHSFKMKITKEDYDRVSEGIKNLS